MFASSIHGLLFCSDRPLPGIALSNACRVGAEPVIVEWSVKGPWMDCGEIAESQLVCRVTSSRGALLRQLDKVICSTRVWWVQRFSDGVQVAFDAEQRKISFFGEFANGAGNFQHYIAGPISSFRRWLDFLPSLHASSVVVDGRIMAIAGDCGAGKSTTTAALALGGCPLFTDDVLGWHVTGSETMANPGPVPVKLWPHAMRPFSLNPAAFQRVAEGIEKRFVEVPAVTSAREYPLGVIYLLERSGELAPGEIRRVAGTAAFLALKAHCRDGAILPSHLRPIQFQALTELARRVPIRRVGGHSGLDRLSSFADALLQDFRSVA